MIRSILLAAIVTLGITGTAVADNAPPEQLLQQAKAATCRGDFDAAIRSYEQVLDCDPRNLEALRNLAWIANDLKKFDRAIRWIELGLAVNNCDADLLLELGYLQWQTGHLAAARSTMNKVLAINPSYAAAYQYLIDICKQQGDFDAIEDVIRLRNQNLTP